MIALALAGLGFLPALQNSVLIEHTLENGDVYCDIQARDFPVRGLMESLCSKLDLDLHGFEDIDNSPKVTVYLRHRPLNVAVEYVLGAAGLSGRVGADRIDVMSQSLPFPTVEHSLQSAEIAYLSALQRFPTGSRSAEARRELGEIALMRGEKEKAARHFEMLAESATGDEEKVAAHMRAGELYVELRDWNRALPHFQEIGNRDYDEKLTTAELIPIAIARRELARCLLMRGEARRAFYMLRGLEKAIKPVSTEDATQRLLIEARAKVAFGDHEGALYDLDRAHQIGAAFIDEFESMDLRATALEAKGHPAEAAVAWLHFSRDKNDDLKREALVRAAQAALSAEGEEFGVIFLHKQAEKEGLGDALVPYLNEARTRLGLDAQSYSMGSPSIRMRRAMQLVTTGFDEEALQVFNSLAVDYQSLPTTDRVLFALTYAPLLEKAEGVSYAIDVLRHVVPTLESVENRSRLYLLAGEIYERNQRFDEAAAAYGGRL